jgi:hypothetical protein
MGDIGNEAVFGPAHREELRSNPLLRPYIDLTKLHLVGLLTALGEYWVRAAGRAFLHHPDAFTPEMVRANDQLIACCIEVQFPVVGEADGR